MQQIQECSQTRDSVKLFEFVKMANVSVLDECFASKSMLFFQPTIESPSITGAFLTKTPEEIYNLGEAPEMDAMFSVTTQVIMILWLLKHWMIKRFSFIQETLGINPMIDRLFDSLWDKNSKPTLLEAMAASKLPQLACERNYTTAFSTVNFQHFFTSFYVLCTSIHIIIRSSQAKYLWRTHTYILCSSLTRNDALAAYFCELLLLYYICK